MRRGVMLNCAAGERIKKLYIINVSVLFAQTVAEAGLKTNSLKKHNAVKLAGCRLAASCVAIVGSSASIGGGVHLPEKETRKKYHYTVTRKFDGNVTAEALIIRLIKAHSGRP